MCVWEPRKPSQAVKRVYDNYKSDAPPMDADDTAADPLLVEDVPDEAAVVDEAAEEKTGKVRHTRPTRREALGSTGAQARCWGAWLFLTLHWLSLARQPPLTTTHATGAQRETPHGGGCFVDASFTPLSHGGLSSQGGDVDDGKVDVDALMAMMDYTNPFTVRDMPLLVVTGSAPSSSRQSGHASRQASGFVEGHGHGGPPSLSMSGGEWNPVAPVGAVSVLRLLEQGRAARDSPTKSPLAESVEDTAIIEGTASDSSRRSDVTPPAEAEAEVRTDFDSRLRSGQWESADWVLQ